MRNQQPLPHSLTPEEQTLLQQFRQLDAGARQYLGRAIEALAQQHLPQDQKEVRHG